MKVKFEFEVWLDDDGVWRAESQGWSAWGASLEYLMREVGQCISRVSGHSRNPATSEGVGELVTSPFQIPG